MSEIAEQLMPTLLALPVEEREMIADRLYESVQGRPTTEVDPAFVVMLNRRIEEIKSGKVKGVPAEEVFRRLREKYS
jgi:putative addiction module component (TIGR02574 family)